MNIPESTNGWIVSAQGEVRPATLEDVIEYPEEVHETEAQVRATVAWCHVVQGAQ